MLKLLRRLLLLGLLAAIGYALWKKLAGSGGGEPTGLGQPSRPTPFPPTPVVPPAPSVPTPVVTAPPSTPAWVEPDDGACPISHPVKAKLASGIFHVSGGQNYERTRADRCYADTSAAEADGLRQAKR